MASILDQFNTKHQETQNQISSEPGSNYVSIKLEDDRPMFSKQKMKLILPQNQDITHLIISNNRLICLMSHQILLRLFLQRPEIKDEIFLEKYLGAYTVPQLFLDPTGNHLIIPLISKATGLSSELLYLHAKSQKPKKIDKFRDHEITAVAWNHQDGSDQTTGPILLGTSKGLIFETELEVDGEKLYYNNWKQVFDLGREKSSPITGLDFYCLSTLNRYIVLATTAEKLYKFQENFKPNEKVILQNIFSAYLNTPIALLLYKDFLNNSEIFSKLRFHMDSTKKYPVHFGWLVEKEFFYGKIDPLAETPDFILEAESIDFPNVSEAQNQCGTSVSSLSKYQKIPKSFIITQFHVIFLYSDHVTAISLLNYSVVYEEYFSEQYGKLLNIFKDPISNSIYVYTSKAIFRYNVTKEDRHAWKLYLEKNNFELAELFAKDNPVYLDIVLCKKAEMAFQSENYLQSAIIYSQTQMSFEKLCFKFFDLPDKKPLMTFLENKIDKLSEDEKAQTTMLVVWMVEVYLTEISRSKDPSGLQKDFDNFMKKPKVNKCVKSNSTVIFELMASHGDQYNLNALTTLNKDYESVINQHINQENYEEALDVLKVQNKTDLYYKYCPILMEEIPRETITAILLQEKNLCPEKLMPALLCIQSELHAQEVIKYLEYVVYKTLTSIPAIHNLLIRLYAQYKKNKLDTYLEAQGRDLSLVHYDVHYALRVCDEYEAKTACVFIKCLLELWEPAVELALECNTKLAQDTASQPQDQELRKKLWLKIAEHEIKGKNDVQKAIEILRICDLLKIEDLLPFFADFQKIDDFKDIICDALKEYNLKIQDQQHDMDESLKAAERVRNELQTLRNRSVTITPQEECGVCEMALLIKPFFIFPCGHKFHGDCLEKQIIPYLSSDETRRLSNLKHQLETMLIVNQNDPIAQQNTLTTREKIKLEIENILASDCLYCGIMIDSIDKPFIQDWDQVNVDWE